MTANFSRHAKPAEDLEWMDRAACKGQPLDLFFPTATKGPGQEGRASQPAKGVCRNCPVREQCLNYALGFSATQLGLYGVWGMTTRRERAGLLGLERMTT